MTQKYMKVYPTVDDIGKTAVIVADETAPNGVSIDFIDSINADDYSEGDFIYRNADGFVSKSISEVKSLLDINNPDYRVIQQVTGNGTTISDTNATLFINEIPDSTIDSSWTKASAGVYYKNITSTGSAFTSTSFSSKRITRNGIIVDEINAEKMVGYYKVWISWSGSVWRLNLQTFNLTGDFDNLTFTTTNMILLETGLNKA